MPFKLNHVTRRKHSKSIVCNLMCGAFRQYWVFSASLEIHWRGCNLLQVHSLVQQITWLNLRELSPSLIDQKDLFKQKHVSSWKVQVFFDLTKHRLNCRALTNSPELTSNSIMGSKALLIFLLFQLVIDRNDTWQPTRVL